MKCLTNNNMLVIDSRVTPLQLLKLIRSPFYGSLTITPLVHSSGTSSESHYLRIISTLGRLKHSLPRLGWRVFIIKKHFLIAQQRS